jgi:tetratricopeptide (TPR) repeat protein
MVLARVPLAGPGLLTLACASAPTEPAERPPVVAVVVPSATAEPAASEPAPSAAAATPPRRRSLAECRATESAEAAARAKQIFKAGVGAMAKGEHEAAAEHFLAAWEVSCKAPLLYNLGVARERAGDFLGAAEAFEHYLDRDPQRSRVEELERRIRDLRARAGQR